MNATNASIAPARFLTARPGHRNHCPLSQFWRSQRCHPAKPSSHRHRRPASHRTRWRGDRPYHYAHASLARGSRPKRNKTGKRIGTDSWLRRGLCRLEEGIGLCLQRGRLHSRQRWWLCSKTLFGMGRT